MKPVICYHNQLLFFKSYQPNRTIRIKPAARLNFVFRPVRFGLKPRILEVRKEKVMDSKSDPPAQSEAEQPKAEALMAPGATAGDSGKSGSSEPAKPPPALKPTPSLSETMYCWAHSRM